MKRRTFEQVRADARRERDGESADYVRRYAERFERGETPVNPHRYSPDESAMIAAVLRAVASSLRAGLADEGGG